jgi:hypothetical protein
VLVTFETEDPAIAMFYSHSYAWGNPSSIKYSRSWEQGLLGKNMQMNMIALECSF